MRPRALYPTYTRVGAVRGSRAESVLKMGSCQLPRFVPSRKGGAGTGMFLDRALPAACDALETHRPPRESRSRRAKVNRRMPS